MNLTAGIPAWVLRGVVGCAVVLIMVLLAGQGVSWLPVGLVGLFGVLTVLAPASPAPSFVIIATAVCLAVASEDPFGIGVLLLLPLVHLVHIGSAVTAVIPGTARVHLAALRPAAVRFVLVQVLVFALAGVAALVPKTVTPAGLEIAALIGVAALALLAARLIMKRPQ
ncbi:hypothetical protein JOF56_001293 [Kibdelosporangium banguiense]|uniref:Uncharacterized protein n=1 Tax=Kibdelosporangium banguiense TaxID=1365924 RepID=A0ABS4T940_9PSEU|nr:hypothetical protein [Kibdelosporangium banguiense]MBP2320908.1 hypothetical protein [Kibdelosporangium banguiense]